MTLDGMSLPEFLPQLLLLLLFVSMWSSSISRFTSCSCLMFILPLLIGDDCELSSRSCDVVSMPDICDERLALSGREMGVVRSLGPPLPLPEEKFIWLDIMAVDMVLEVAAPLPLPIDELPWPDIMPDVGVVEGVLMVTVPLPLLPIDVLAVIRPEDIVVEGVFEAVEVFVWVGDESAGDGVASGIDGMSDDIGVLGLRAFDAIGPFDMRLGDGLGTGIIDGLLLSIGVDGIPALFRPND